MAVMSLDSYERLPRYVRMFLLLGVQKGCVSLKRSAFGEIGATTADFDILTCGVRLTYRLEQDTYRTPIPVSLTLLTTSTFAR